MRRLSTFWSAFLIVCMCVSMLYFVGSFTGCEWDETSEYKDSSQAVSSIQAKDQQITAENYERLFKAVPPPKLKDSQERKNIARRLERFNVANKISYIYLIDFGKVMSYYTIKGKVSSVNSMLTCTEQLVDDGKGRYNGRDGVHVVASPDLDGSYGSNGDGIFFFTTEDVYVEWNKTYLLSDQPLKLSTPPELVYVVKVE